MSKIIIPPETVKQFFEDVPKRVTVYIAHPYTAETSSIEGQNVKKAIDIFNKLLAMGYIPFCPLLCHYSDQRYRRQNKGKSFPYETYIQYCLSWIPRCQAFYFGGTSQGTIIERNFAIQNHTPIFYDFDELQRALPTLSFGTVQVYETNTMEETEEIVKEIEAMEKKENEQQDSKINLSAIAFDGFLTKGIL